MGSLWNRSGTIERFADDLRAPGAKAFFFRGGTTTPLTVFRDSDESSTFPTPVVADATGRWPDIFVPYITSYDVQTKTENDVQLTYTRKILNSNPLDATTILPTQDGVLTGMIHAEFTTNVTRVGYVRLNGNTIGNAASGGTERANADCQNLFVFLYNNIPDSLAPVSGGRTAGGATGDFNLNKTIKLPDCRGRVLVGADQMGSSEVGAFTGITFDTGGGDTSGSTTGKNLFTLVTANMPAHIHTGTTDVGGGHFHQIQNPGVQSTTTGANVDHTHGMGHGTVTVGSSGTLDHVHQFVDSVFNPSVGTASGAQAPGGTQGTVASTTTSARLIANPAAGYDLAHTHAAFPGGDTDGQSQTHTHQFFINFPSGVAVQDGTGTPTHVHSFTTSISGGSVGFNNMPLSILVNWFIKL